MFCVSSFGINMAQELSVICFGFQGNVRDEGAHSDTDKGISETDGNEKAALGEQVRCVLYLEL